MTGQAAAQNRFEDTIQSQSSTRCKDGRWSRFGDRCFLFPCPGGVWPRANHEIRFAQCQAIFRNKCVTTFGFVKFGAKHSPGWNIEDQLDHVSDLDALTIRPAMNVLNRSGSSPIAWNSATSASTSCAALSLWAKRHRQAMPRWQWLKFDRTVGAGKFLRPRASNLCSQRSVKQSITRRIARAFAQARFAFWIRAVMSSAWSRSTTRIESCDAALPAFTIKLATWEARTRGRFQRVAARSKCVQLPGQSAILKQTLLRNKWAWRHNPKILT